VVETFQITNDYLAAGVRGVWRLLRHKGLIEVHFADLAALLRDRHGESLFAVAEAMGPARSREVMDKLLGHPMLDGGQLLGESEAVLVSLIGGPDLTMAEVNRVMEQVNRQCEHAQVMMGAAIDPAFSERLAVTLIATRQEGQAEAVGKTDPAGHSEELLAQLLPRSTTRPGSRIVPPAPALPPEQVQQLLAGQGRTGSRGRKSMPRMRQGQLPLEIVSKGRFDKSEPTIHKGEDLDVPTYIRRGVPLN
jgi:cell division protein FtsZ